MQAEEKIKNPEESIMGWVIADHSWEQIIYHLIEIERLNPWDIDLEKLATVFVNYVEKLEEIDFHVPAKIVLIASILLRMKSDGLGFEEDIVLPEFETPMEEIEKIEVKPLNVPLKRQPRRRVSVTDLIEALRRILEKKEKKELAIQRRQERMELTIEDVTERIENLYKKILMLYNHLNKETVEFSVVVGDWKRKNIVENFMPMLHLEEQKKIRCDQKDFFEEIFISLREKKS